MDEDVLAVRLVADEEAVTLQPVEPLDPHRLELAGLVEQGRRIDPLGRRAAAGEIGHHRLRKVDREHLAGLQAALLLRDQAFDDRAFRKAAPVVLLQHREMDEDVARGLIADQEAEPARGIEPLYRAGELDQGFVARLGRGFGRARPSRPILFGGGVVGSHFAAWRHQRAVHQISGR